MIKKMENKIGFFQIQFMNTFENADAAVFLTEWEEFESLNWQDISKKMRKTIMGI